MNTIKSLFLTIACATPLMGCTVYTTESYVYDTGYRHAPRPYIAEPIYYERPVVMRPHMEPIYARPQGVARPDRFVCGADVFTGHHNCVKRSKAHFVRPMGYAPSYRPHSGYPEW